MILADKIINERKRCGWSQEELADQLSVSRQSVSKWEGAQAVPDLQKIIKMAELFGVSTDYLLKDEISDNGYIEERLEGAEISNIRKVSMEEANAYLECVKENSPKIGIGVMLCVLSTAFLMVFCAFSESIMKDRQGLAIGIGMTIMFIMIAVAVLIFIVFGSKYEKYKYLKEEEFETAYGVDGMVKDRREKVGTKNTVTIAVGVLAIIIAIIPIIVSSFLDPTGVTTLYMVALLLAVIAIAVYYFVKAGSVTESFKVLLKEEEFASKSSKKNSNILGGIATAYWVTITAVFLYLNIVLVLDKAWIIWPIAGLAFAGIMAILNAVLKEE